MTCTHCKALLNRQQFSADETWKSCPRCSTDDGSEHIFYQYPEAFGVTEKRASQTHPEGPQSYCTACRNNASPATPVRRCSQI